MSITFRCPTCNGILNVGNALVGTVIHCGGCQQAILVPPAAVPVADSHDDSDWRPRARLGWSVGVVVLLTIGVLLLVPGGVGLAHFLATHTRTFAGTGVPWTVSYFQSALTSPELALLQQTGVIFSAIGASMGLFVTSLGMYFLRFGGRHN